VLTGLALTLGQALSWVGFLLGFLALNGGWRCGGTGNWSTHGIAVAC